MNWIDEQEEKNQSERSKDYFNITEGKQQFILLSHCAPLAQVWDGKKYRIAEEGDTNISMKGLCWVYQDGVIKSAKLPYTVVKHIRAIQQDPEWDFKLPFLHAFTLTAKGAGTKEVEYSLNASPKQTELPQSVLDELAKKPTPEELVEKIKGKVSQGNTEVDKGYDYPAEEPIESPF